MTDQDSSMDGRRVFIAYTQRTEEYPGDHVVVQQLHYFLQTQPGIKPQQYMPNGQPWNESVEEMIDDCDAFVVVLGKNMGSSMMAETSRAFLRKKPIYRVSLPGLILPLPLEPPISTYPNYVLRSSSADEIMAAAIWIARALTDRWIPHDGLPEGYPFDYEKDIIDAYSAGAAMTDELLRAGCPSEWPKVQCHAGGLRPTSLELKEVGSPRSRDAEVIVDARSHQTHQPLHFLEAGPRKEVYFNGNAPGFAVAIVVSGGIAPGINAVIASLIERQRKYGGNTTIFGISHGFKGLREGARYFEKITLGESELKDMAKRAGSFLGTSRDDDFLFADPEERSSMIQEMLSNLKTHKVSVLYVIGGDGSMRAAQAMSVGAELHPGKLSIVGIPKTMDNDILWVWQSFGFASAVEQATLFARQLYAEASSNPRVCVMQLFGSDSGFVVSHAALASGVCDAALIPEKPFSMEKVADHVFEKLELRLNNEGRGFGMIMMAETAIPTDFEEYINDPGVGLKSVEVEAIRRFVANGSRVRGQTPDELRSGGLRLVSRVLEQKIQSKAAVDPYWSQMRTFVNQPRHLIRSMQPSSIDVIFARRLGSLAVDNAMAGFTNFMVSQWLTEFVLVPLPLVVLGRKRVPDGIFWKSVIANTGQPTEDRVDEDPGDPEDFNNGLEAGAAGN